MLRPGYVASHLDTVSRGTLLCLLGDLFFHPETPEARRTASQRRFHSSHLPRDHDPLSRRATRDLALELGRGGRHKPIYSGDARADGFVVFRSPAGVFLALAVESNSQGQAVFQPFRIPHARNVPCVDPLSNATRRKRTLVDIRLHVALSRLGLSAIGRIVARSLTMSPFFSSVGVAWPILLRRLLMALAPPVVVSADYGNRLRVTHYFLSQRTAFFPRHLELEHCTHKTDRIPGVALP